MKQGDFTELAKHYGNRPAYSERILNAILKIQDFEKKQDFRVVEIGAGTGKLTRMLLEMGLNVLAVEPNDEMRVEGEKYTADLNPEASGWQKGSGEETGIETGAADWAVMASSFHWTDPNRSLPEIARILKPGGHFTAIWNPRNIEASEFHMRIERKIYEIAPNISRVSSGSKKHTQDWAQVLTSTAHFQDVLFMECDHIEKWLPSRYLGAWESVNDIQAQAGPEKWQAILSMIKEEIAELDFVETPYKMRAWTARKVS